MAKNKQYILSIDQGTTSSRGVLFDENYEIISIGQNEFTQFFPDSGWVEHDPEEIWTSTLESCRSAIKQSKIDPSQIRAIGITNQRETTVVWDKETGMPIYNAIVWQDRRTSDYCQSLRSLGHESLVNQKTGLLLDPYFCATKIAWILDNVDGAREKANKGGLLFGTIDCFLMWRLSNQKIHSTDATNACRTLLYNIHEGCWDKDLLDLFNVPASMLPEVYDNAADFGVADESIFGSEIAIAASIGDQPSALVGQACFHPGMVKSTYGTGCFVLINTGYEPVKSNNKLLTTLAFQVNGKTCYALEGSIFIAGAAVQWLRDGLKFIESAEQSETLAMKADDSQDVYLVPAFVGLGAPHWDPDCRGALFGMTRNTGPAEITKATLESVCYQTSDLLSAISKDLGESKLSAIRVDGGMAASNWTMQMLSDLVELPVDRPKNLETTALGAAYLAGMQVGFYPPMDEFSDSWQSESQFNSKMKEELRARKLAGWKDAVRRTLSNN
ncbi:glycerol kinase GlpK [Pseudothioglobus sp. nBUS_23]|uniref:glycerol kinase GlpK n=1 Tax=Pseudothioglobus sp. nBUS_23 TaxID=3395318 RepID=UPI003EB74463